MIWEMKNWKRSSWGTVNYRELPNLQKLNQTGKNTYIHVSVKIGGAAGFLLFEKFKWWLSAESWKGGIEILVFLIYWTIDILGWILPCGGTYPVYWVIFSRIPGLYPQNASSTALCPKLWHQIISRQVVTPNYLQTLPNVPGGGGRVQNCPRLSTTERDFKMLRVLGEQKTCYEKRENQKKSPYMRKNVSVTINELNQVFYNDSYKHLRALLIYKSELEVLQCISVCNCIIFSKSAQKRG